MSRKSEDAPQNSSSPESGWSQQPPSSWNGPQPQEWQAAPPRGATPGYRPAPPQPQYWSQQQQGARIPNQYQGPWTSQPAPPPPEKIGVRWSRVAVVGLVFALFIVAWPRGSGEDKSALPAGAPTSTSSSAPAASAAQAPASAEARLPIIGQPARANDLSFTVTNYSVVKKLSSVLGSKSGNWIVMTVKIQNQGRDSHMVNNDDFTLIEPDGTEFSTDSDSLMYVENADQLFLEQINPRLSKTGKVLFAVPKGVTGDGLTLRAQESLFDSTEILLKRK